MLSAKECREKWQVIEHRCRCSPDDLDDLVLTLDGPHNKIKRTAREILRAGLSHQIQALNTYFAQCRDNLSTAFKEK